MWVQAPAPSQSPGKVNHICTSHSEKVERSNLPGLASHSRQLVYTTDLWVQWDALSQKMRWKVTVGHPNIHVWLPCTFPHTHALAPTGAHTYTIQIKSRESWDLSFKADFCSLQILLFLKNHPEHGSDSNDLLPQSFTLQAAFWFFFYLKEISMHNSLCPSPLRVSCLRIRDYGIIERCPFKGVSNLQGVGPFSAG